MVVDILEIKILYLLKTSEFFKGLKVGDLKCVGGPGRVPRPSARELPVFEAGKVSEVPEGPGLLHSEVLVENRRDADEETQIQKPAKSNLD